MNEPTPASTFTRRNLIAAGAAGSALILAQRAHAASAATTAAATAAPATLSPSHFDGPFQLAPLPYKEDALAPHISANTISFHYGKHHAGYVEKLNKGISSSAKYDNKSLEDVIQISSQHADDVGVFNNAAQAWNHAFYWKSMKPGGGGEPTGKLADAIKEGCGNFAAFKNQFGEASNTLFGSGWCWLVSEGGKLRIVRTSNADTPITKGQKPLLVLDVWEHAYYLDVQNKRADYVSAFLEKLVNWDFAAQNFAG
jgi:Fe-Mn family superoxide dismutase